MQGKMHSFRSLTRLFVLCLCVATALTLLAGLTYAEDGDSSGTAWKDGTYEGTGTGRNGDVTVSVTISGGKIVKIEEVSQKETESYWEKAKVLLTTIVEQQSADVDSISGATKSSDAIKSAVKNALGQAAEGNDLYAGGSGTEKDPYVIKNAEQLQNFAKSVDEGENYAGQYVALGEDIDLSDIENWDPVGDEKAATADSNDIFAGTFDGKGHSINGMTISGDYTAETNVGLFSVLNNTATVRDLHMKNVSVEVKGSEVVRAGSISGDTVTKNGSVGTILDSDSAEGTVKVGVSGAKLAFAGGITGRASAYTAFANCWSSVDTDAASTGGNLSAYAAGISGMCGLNVLIVNCASFGSARAVSPKSTNYGGMAGGMSAMVSGKMWNTYATGDATAGNGGTTHKWVGALAGQITVSGMVTEDGNRVYPDTGALRDYAYYSGDAKCTLEKWSGADTLESSEVVETVAAGSSENKNLFDGQFTAEKMAAADMTGESFAEKLNGNLRNVSKLLEAYGYTGITIRNWKESGGKILPAGEKWIETEPDAAIFESGTGTKDDPYAIRTKEQLLAFAGSFTAGIDYSGKYVRLEDDIDLSGENWTSAGGSNYAFNGVFDGAGHTVKGMTMGTAEDQLVLEDGEDSLGFFGCLEKEAVVKDLKLTQVSIYASGSGSLCAGGITAYKTGASGSDRSGAIIDGCSVKGTIHLEGERGNSWVGGIAGYQVRGSVINCDSDVDVSCIVRKGDAIAQAGGLVGINNRGLVANSYSLGDVYGSASRSDGDEGMAATGQLVAVNAGDLVGCYSAGNNETGEYSVYAGAVTGWVTGIAKTYTCWYNADSTMKINGKAVNPVADIGTKVAPGVSEDGETYTGGLVDRMVSYDKDSYSGIAGSLNANLDAYPIDITQYGLGENALRQWKYDEESSIVLLSDEQGTVKYEKPDAENVPQEEQVMKDGTWYGRDSDKKTIVSIKVENEEVVSDEAVQ